MDIKEDRNRLNEVRRGNNVFELPRDQLLNLNHVHNNQTITSQLSGQELLSAEEEEFLAIYGYPDQVQQPEIGADDPLIEQPPAAGYLNTPESLVDFSNIPFNLDATTFDPWRFQDDFSNSSLQVKPPIQNFHAAGIPSNEDSARLFDMGVPTTNVPIYNAPFQDLFQDPFHGLFNVDTSLPSASLPGIVTTGTPESFAESVLIPERQRSAETRLSMRGAPWDGFVHTMNPQVITSLPYTKAQVTDFEDENTSVTKYGSFYGSEMQQNSSDLCSFSPGVRTSLQPQQQWDNVPTSQELNTDLEPPSGSLIIGSSKKGNGKARRARRSTGLSLEKRGKVANVRKAGACWYCRIKKIPCDINRGDCYRCQQKRGVASSIPGTICRRESFTNFTEMFYVDYKVAPFEEENVKWMITKDVAKFSQNKFEVELFCMSLKYPLIRQTVSEVIPFNLDVLRLPRLHKSSSSLEPERPESKATRESKWRKDRKDAYWFEICCDPIDTDWSLSRTEIRNFVEGSIKAGRDQENDKFVLNLRPFASQIMCLLENYTKKSSSDILVKKAWVAFTYDVLLVKELKFTDKTTEALEKGMSQRALDNNKRLHFSLLVNHQLKTLVLAETRTAMADVLVGLDQQFKDDIKKRSKRGWRLLIGFNWEYDYYDSNRMILYIRHLEVYIIDYATEIFRNIYHPLPNSKQGKGRYSKFNPIRDGLAANDLDGITQEMSELVEGLRDIVVANREEMQERDRPPTYFYSANSVPPILTATNAKAQISGRLLSRVLMWFL